jgi:hypothetical protein
MKGGGAYNKYIGTKLGSGKLEWERVKMARVELYK